MTLDSSAFAFAHLVGLFMVNMTESSLGLAASLMKPLALPVAGSTADIAWYSCARGTQCGGYLKRAVSRIRTMSFLA